MLGKVLGGSLRILPRGTSVISNMKRAASKVSAEPHVAVRKTTILDALGQNRKSKRVMEAMRKCVEIRKKDKEIKRERESPVGIALIWSTFIQLPDPKAPPVVSVFKADMKLQ